MVAEVVYVGGACMKVADARVVGQVVRTQAMVLRCVVAGADGGGGLRWPEPMVEAACMHVWAHVELSCVMWCSVIRPGEVRCNCISLFKENYYSDGLC
jgi:hypothetical protein